MTLGVILAGGRATRMGGGDKGFLDLGGQSVLSYVLDRLGPQVAAMALNANGDPKRFAELGLTVIPDAREDRPGPLAGVLAGMDWAASEGAADIVTVAADTPFYPTDLVARLEGARTDPGQIILAATQEGSKTWRHPTFGLWPVALRDDLRAALANGVRKVVQWTDSHDCRSAIFSGADPFFNINTPEDLDLARKRLNSAAQ